MAQVFIVEDEFHADWVARFSTRLAAAEFLDHLRMDPEAVENRAPCGNWMTCKRQYHLLEFEDSAEPWTLTKSEPQFEVREGQVRPIG